MFIIQGKNGRNFGTGSNLVIQTHQQLVLKNFISLRSDFLRSLYSSAIIKSPSVSQSRNFKALTNTFCIYEVPCSL
jgi:hypothetical protein